MVNLYKIDGKKVTQKQWYDHLEKMYSKQMPYAELGRLAVKAIDAYTTTNYDSKPCEGSYNSLGKGEVCSQCNWFVFCQKRAELRAGGVSNE